MKYKVGDKVKFLNETGGGVVSKIVSGSLVYVATEDGFELPMPTGELLKMEAETRVEKMFAEDFNVDLEKTIKENTADTSQDHRSKVKKGAEEAPGVFLAYVPSDQQWYITGDVEIRLVNHSKYDILYNFLLQDEEGNYFGFDYGSVDAGSSAALETIDRENLSGWTDGAVQIMVHDETGAYLPLQANFHIKAGKFSTEGSYLSSGLIAEKAIIYRLSAEKDLKSVPGKYEPVKVEEFQVETKASEQKKESLVGRYAVGPHAAVVDLHIGEIVDNIAGLSSHDMFLLQINHFVKVLESGIKNNFRKITFIHGVGNGVLKNAIVEKLKEYSKLQGKSASLAEYGQGAIDVLIHSQES